jgi:hypothetical protein
MIFDFWCFNATFNNISAISWRPVLVVEEAAGWMCSSFSFIQHRLPHKTETK